MAIDSLCTSSPTNALIWSRTVDPPQVGLTRRYQVGPYCLRRSAREIPRTERKAMIERDGEVSVKRQAQLLDLSRSSVYYAARSLPERDLALMRMLTIPLDHRFALSPGNFPSAAYEKEFSIVSSPIFACSSRMRSLPSAARTS